MKLLNYITYYKFKSVLYLWRRLLWYLELAFLIQTINDCKMFLMIGDFGLSRELYIYRIREKDQMYILRNEVKKGMRVLDIGANIGYYSLFLAKLGARVIAYEPHPLNFMTLRRNLSLNNIHPEVYIEAVSDSQGKRKFYISKKSNLHSLQPINANKMKEEMVDTQDIKQILQGIDLIRMDIEGGEVPVLRGIARTDYTPSILFEAHCPKYNPLKKETDIYQPLIHLFKRGYRVKYATPNKERTSPFRVFGYKPKTIIKTDGVYRGIYENISDYDIMDCLKMGGVRAIYLEHKEER